MNYNFSSQFPFPWSSTNPYMPNGFPGASNTTPMQQTTSQTQFSIPQPGGQPAQGYNCSTIVGPGVRFPTGVYPYGMNGTFPTTNSFPANWNFSYNAVQSPVAQPSTPVQPVPLSQNVPQISMAGDITGNITNNGHVMTDTSVAKTSSVSAGISSGGFTDQIVEKVSTLLSDPKILKSALSKLKNVSGPNASNDNVTQSPVQLQSHTDSLQTMSNYLSDTDSSLDLESEAPTAIENAAQHMQMTEKSVSNVRLVLNLFEMWFIKCEH